MDIFNTACVEGVLPDDFLLGDIVLLPKKGNQLSLDFKRPITLLNTKYKIFSKIWQNRLSIVADNIIGWNQFAFIKGRSIHHAILLGSEMIHYAKVQQIPITFLKIDFKKAFDKLQWSFLHQLFLIMQFGPRFAKVLAAITYGSKSQLLIIDDTNFLLHADFPMGQVGGKMAVIGGQT